MQIEELTIGQIHAAYVRSDLSAAELVSAYLERIEFLDRSGPALNSIVTVADDALESAEVLDRHFGSTGALSGPLHGIPVVIKDQVETAGLRTTYGSRAAVGNVPTRDAEVVRRLRAAGAVVLGKSTMADFGAAWFSTSSLSGVTRNPYAFDHDAGGSSSGTAAAVAANLATVGIGGDTGGSIRVPASFCNLVGLRATPGLISRDGIAPLVVPQDTAGPMTRTVTDAARLMEVLVCHPRGGSGTASPGVPHHGCYVDGLTGASLQGARLGVLTDLLDPSGDAGGRQVTDVFTTALATFEDAGATVVGVQIPELARLLQDTSLYASRSRDDLDQFISSRPGIDADDVADLHARGLAHPALDLLEVIASSPGRHQHDPDYAARIGARELLRRLVLDLMSVHRVEVLCFPDVQVPPPSQADVLSQRWTVLDYPTNTVLASQTDLPALSVPIGFTPDGLPVGLEVLGRPFDEGRLLRIGRAVEGVTAARRSPRLPR
jgi:amidase